MILYILLFIIILLILLPTILFSVISFFLSFLGFRVGRNSRTRYNTRSGETSYKRSEPHETASNNHSRKKIFDKDDGEYVDYEEIK